MHSTRDSEAAGMPLLLSTNAKWLSLEPLAMNRGRRNGLHPASMHSRSISKVSYSLQRECQRKIASMTVYKFRPLRTAVEPNLMNEIFKYNSTSKNEDRDAIVSLFMR